MMCRKILFIALLTFFVASIAAASDPNLVGWYKFDETSGTVAADSSGYGHNATVNSSTGWDTSGYDGGCLHFTGSLTVSVPAAVFTNVKEQVTISVWVNGNTAYPDTTQMPFHGSAPDKGRALRVEMPGGANSIWFAAGDTTPSLNDGYDQHAWWSPPQSAYQGQWNNFTFVKNNIADVNEPTWIIYWNGLIKSTRDDLTASMSGIDTFTIGNQNNGSNPYYGRLDEFKIWDRALSRAEIADMLGVDLDKATNPRPLDGQEQVAAGVTLVWDAGLQAESHDVYLGTDETAVATATTASAEYMGNFPEAWYQPAEELDLGMVYYWRVDEVNDIDIWYGDVWSFTVIPPLPPLPDPILWLKMDGPTDPNTPRFVEDSSGNEMHGLRGSSDQWIDIPGIGGGIDFDGGYYGASGITFDVNDILDVITPNLSDEVTVSCWVTWTERPDRANYLYDGRNDLDIRLLSNECPTGDYIRNHCGGKDIWVWDAFRAVNPSFFRDGTTWGDYQRLTTTVDLNTGAFKMYIDNELYTSQTVTLGGSMDGITKFWVGRRNDSYQNMVGHMADFRLYNEVLRPEHIAELVGDYPYFAKAVYPKHQSVENPLDSILEWRAGKEAVAHDVYFGRNYAAIANADTSSSYYMGRQAGTTFDPGTLELMKTYYWRIDEVDGDDNLMEGPVWQFDTVECIMVEDFEAYADGGELNAVWEDKIGEGDIAIALAKDPDPVLSPVNSMRITAQIWALYPPHYAIASRSFSPAQDWTENGVRMLTIHYYGSAGNADLPVFVTIGDGVTDANVFIADADIRNTSWNQLNVPLPAIAAAGVDLTNITYLEIGLGDGTPGNDQHNYIYIDDIALYPPTCVPSESSLLADITGDCVVDYDDLAYIAQGWLSDLEDADFNDDGIVDFKDYSILANEWLVEDFWP